MAQVATCPQCAHDMLVPGEMSGQSWAKCPECRAFFQVETAERRELRMAIVAEAQPPESSFEPVERDKAPEILASEPLHELPETVLADEVGDTEIAGPESDDELNAAAKRIDDWFRSAKTVPDVPPFVANEPATEGLSEASSSDELTLDEFKLEKSDDRSQTAAAWDDSDRISDLLDGDSSAVAEEAPERTTQVEQVRVEQPRADYASAVAGVSASDMPVFNKSTNGKGRRNRSFLRTLTMLLLSSVIGLSAGYYALLWLRPSADFLNVAQYLPAVMLPAELQAQPRQVASAAPPISERPAAPAPMADMEADENEIAAIEEEPENAAESAIGDVEPGHDGSEEVQASFTEEEPLASIEQDESENRYDLNANEPPAAEEPAALNAPPAMPLAELENESMEVQDVRVGNAPSFTAEEMAASLEAAKQAQPSLVKGNLADGRDVARAKGYSYSLLADLAQKVTFAESPSPEAVELFRQTLSDQHTRQEVAAILPKWINSPHRKHGGVFFAAEPGNVREAGSVIQFTGSLASGQSVPVIAPREFSQQVQGSAQPLGVVGWIVDRPAETISGYSANAPQAVWVGELIPLH